MTISGLVLERLRLQARVGVGFEERRHPQALELSFALRLPAAPEACESDEISQTQCYALLADRARAAVAARPFHLLESMAFEVRRALLASVPKGSRLVLRIKKVHAPVEGLEGGASFVHGDFDPAGWL